MTLKIFWTPEAVKSYENILNYLEKNWTLKDKQNFESESQKLFNLLSSYPRIFKKSIKKNIRIALITKHNILVYRIKKQSIEFLQFSDTRIDPSKLKF